MACENCRVLQSKLQRIMAIVEEDAGFALRRGRQVKILTEAGRVISSEASAQGRKLTEVSRAAGFAADYAGKLCRGELPLSRRAAKLFGDVLGVDLSGMIEERKAPAAVPEPLPFAPGPCAVDARERAS